MKTKTSKVKPKPLAVPQYLVRRLVKRFKTRDQKHLVMVLRDVMGAGHFEIWFSGRSQEPACAIAFLGSDMPEPVRAPVTRQMAIWWARIVAHRNLVRPSEKEVGSHRRSEIKKALKKLKAHEETKQVVHRLHHPRVTPVPKPTPERIPLPYVFVYDPRAIKRARKNQPTVFTVHQADCPTLDGRRRSVAKRGATWVVEQISADLAIVDQLAEFEEEQKGYDRSDFTVHSCELCD